MVYTELQFIIKVKSNNYNINWFWTNNLRGFIGKTLKRKFCILKKTPCNKCVVRSNCSYYQTYEIENKKWRISPPNKEILKLGDNFSFKIILWDKNINYALHIIKAIEIFQNRLLKIDKVNNFNNCIYNNKRILSDIKTRKIDGLKDSLSSNIILNLRTPLRIKKNKRLITNFNEKNASSIFNLKSKKDIKIIKIFEDWIDFKRYSYRQKSYLRLGGIIGKYKIIDKSGELTSNLMKGQILGIGKAKTFGFGDITLTILN